MADMTVRRLDATDLNLHLPALVTLLINVVEGGASVGFLAPLDDGIARSYWDGVRAAMPSGHRILLGACERDTLIGAAQLNLASMPNGQHRAEVVKLIVHRDARRNGVGRALMRAIEDSAREAGRQLLVLDTRVGDTASDLYAK